MAEREIRIASGSSWIYDRLVGKIEDRIQRLRERCTDSCVPLHEYPNFVGRIRELKEVRDTMLVEVFQELADDDFEYDDEETEV